jgi:hypothetical protein
MAEVFVLNPPVVKDFCRSARWAARSRGRVQRHPDWLLTAVAVLEQAGLDVAFLDGAAMNLGRQQVVFALKKKRPRLLVLHTTTPSIDSDLGYASLAKKLVSDCKTVAVGPHVTAEPEDTLHRAKESLDVVVRGEYDYTLRELAELAGSGWGTSKLAGILGISYVDDEGQAVHTPARPYLDANGDGTVTLEKGFPLSPFSQVEDASAGALSVGTCLSWKEGSSGCAILSWWWMRSNTIYLFSLTSKRLCSRLTPSPHPPRMSAVSAKSCSGENSG